MVGLLVVLIVPLFLSFLAVPGLCCFLRVTHTHTHTHIYIYSAICMYVYTNLKISAGGRANGGDAENGVLHGESPKRLAPPRNVVYRGRCVRSSRAQEDNATVAKAPRCREAALHADVSLVCSFMNRQPKSTAVLGPRGQHAYAHIRMGSYKRVKGRSHTVEKRKAIHPQRPHATSQPSRFSHTPRLSTDAAHN